jgi:hypothetical protein
MLFQTFDDKQECVLVYQNNQFFSCFNGLDMSHTWAYAPYLKHLDIQYGQIWMEGETLPEICPDFLKEEFNIIQKRMKGIVRSCYETSLNLDEICFYELLPTWLLKDYANIKDRICKYVFENHTKPANYDHVLNLIKVISEIKYQSLDLDLRKIKGKNLQERNLLKNIKNSTQRILYNPFKTKTGRLVTTSTSFPVLTLPKEYREVIQPTNDWLCELDFNAAELRTVLGLLGHEQPQEDLHEWNIKNLFKSGCSREDAKKRIFAWLYNPAYLDKEINSIYNREKVKANFHHNGKVVTPFGREIECDDFHAVNYVIQSTAADLLFEQMYKVWELLENKKSFIKFCNHDSIIIDLASEDEKEIGKIKNIFSDTRYGQFKVSCMGGKSWGAMRKLNVF